MRFPRPAAVVIVALAALICLLTVVDQFQPISDADFFWHLKTGEWIWQHQALPATDPFAYPTPAHLNAMQRFTLTSYWLSQTAFYLLYLLGGFPAVVCFKFALVGLLILALLLRKRGDPLVFTAVLALGLVALGMYPLERPQAFSFVLYGVLLALLDRLREREPAGRMRFAALIALPAVMLLWANTHGAYLLGQATILLVLTLEAVKFLHPRLEPLPAATYRRLLAAGGLGLAFSFLNPNTYHAIEYLRAPAAAAVTVNIEYLSTLSVFTRLNLYRIPVYWLLQLLTLAGLVIRWRKPDITTIALLLGLGVVSFTTSRYVPFFIVAAVPLIAAAFSGARVRKGSGPALACVACALLLYFAWSDRGAMIVPGRGAWTDENFPAQEADFIVAQDLQGNLYNNPNWGGYLMWRLAPARKVYSDGRSLDQPSYQSTAYIDNARVGSGFGGAAWKRLLDSYDIQYVLTPLFSRGVLYPLVSALLGDPEWPLVYTGYNSLIFVRQSALNARVIAARSLSKERFLDDSIAWYSRQAAREPGNMFLQLTTAELLLGRRRFPEARAAYRRVLELAPFNAVARERLKALP